MNDFSQLLINKTDKIVEQWVEAVRGDMHIESANDLPHTSVRNDMPEVLKAMVTVLSQYQENDIKSVIDASLEHGIVRAEQGFDPAEIAREYGVLRRVIFSTLEEGLLTGTPQEMMRAIRLIDAVIDAAIAKCFQSYTEERLGELNHLQNQLTLNNQELTRLVRSSQDNLSHLAHELKNPLTSIIGYSDLFLRIHRLNDEESNSFTNLEHIERVLRNGRHLLRLINDALEISRFEAGKMQLEPEETDVRYVINEVLAVMQPLAGEKELKIIVDIEHAPEQVITDSLRLQQVLTNLISNAIRYTESGTIEVMCKRLDNQQWAIAVCDTGIGIDPEAQQHIFEPYFQVAASATRLPNSTGLGLAIVSRLVTLLQGKIELVSQLGIGSTFTVTFPLEVNNIHNS
jgi:signal transduction histidine kinase